MMLSGTVSKGRIISSDDAWEELAKLIEMHAVELQGVTTYTGNHPDFGHTILVIPAFGESLIITPFANHKY